jgi:hypothetical protein
MGICEQLVEAKVKEARAEQRATINDSLVRFLRNSGLDMALTDTMLDEDKNFDDRDLANLEELFKRIRAI